MWCPKSNAGTPATVLHSIQSSSKTTQRRNSPTSAELAKLATYPGRTKRADRFPTRNEGCKAAGHSSVETGDGKKRRGDIARWWAGGVDTGVEQGPQSSTSSGILAGGGQVASSGGSLLSIFLCHFLSPFIIRPVSQRGPPLRISLVMSLVHFFLSAISIIYSAIAR